MADEKETGVEPEVKDAPAEDVVVVDDSDDQNVRTEEESPLEGIAREIGWTPKDQFKGDPEKWKPAEEYIRASKDINKSLSKDVRELRSTVENMSRTSATLLQQQLADRDAYWASQRAAAVEEGDNNAADYADQQRAAVQQEYARTMRPTITNEAAEFAERNRAWFQKDPLATRRAFEVTEAYAQSGAPAHEQLAAAERQIRKEFPELFSSAKQPPSVNGSGGRTAGVSGRKKGFHDMPAEAQAVAKDMVNRGSIPDTDEYVRHYFAEKR